MTTSDRPSQGGNDGTWFIRAVGLAPLPTTLDEVEAETTTEAVRQLWNAGSDDPLVDWSPDGLNSTIEGDRRFRWPVVISVLVVVAALIGVALWLPGTSERRADLRADGYLVALGDIRTDLPAVQQALAAITEPDADASQFADLVPTIADLRADADGALELADDPLPRAWPLASNAPFTDLAPHPDAVSAHATTAHGIARRLGDVLTYRTLFAEFLATGDLPTESSQVRQLNTQLAAATADAAIILSELPEDAALVEHRAAAEALASRFTQWQGDYTEALRNGATEAAVALIEELTAARSQLETLMGDALATIRREVDAAIIQLADDIDATVLQLGQT